MRKNFGVQTWLYPMPVLIVATYDENGVPDAMNAAWGGIHDTNQIGICIDPAHRTAANLRRSGCFTVSVGTAAQLAQCDYVGMVSANQNPAKLAAIDWHMDRSEFVDAPLIRELPFALECRLVSFAPETGCTVGEIVNVSVDTAVLDGDGKPDPEKINPLVFDPVHHLYRALGAAAGPAFQAGLALKK